MKKTKKFVEQLRTQGLKVTPQRLAIYELLKNTNTHPTVESIYNLLHTQYPMMSLATVYKTVESLSKANLIQMLNTGEDSFRYDGFIHPHAHVQCNKCSRVDDVPDFATEEDISIEVARQTGYTLTHRQLYFFGTCPNCSGQQ